MIESSNWEHVDKRDNAEPQVADLNYSSVSKELEQRELMSYLIWIARIQLNNHSVKRSTHAYNMLWTWQFY